MKIDEEFPNWKIKWDRDSNGGQLTLKCGNRAEKKILFTNNWHILKEYNRESKLLKCFPDEYIQQNGKNTLAMKVLRFLSGFDLPVFFFRQFPHTHTRARAPIRFSKRSLQVTAVKRLFLVKIQNLLYSIICIVYHYIYSNGCTNVNSQYSESYVNTGRCLAWEKCVDSDNTLNDNKVM